MLLQTVGQKLDSEKAKVSPQQTCTITKKVVFFLHKFFFFSLKTSMDKYFSEIERVTKGRQTSDNITVMLQDLLDLRKVNMIEEQCSSFTHVNHFWLYIFNEHIKFQENWVHE